MSLIWLGYKQISILHLESVSSCYIYYLLINLMWKPGDSGDGIKILRNYNQGNFFLLFRICSPKVEFKKRKLIKTTLIRVYMCITFIDRILKYFTYS